MCAFFALVALILAVLVVSVWVYVWALERRTADEFTRAYARIDDVRARHEKADAAIREEFRRRLDKGFL